MPIVLESGNLILLESSGPVQACKGMALTYEQITPFSYVYLCKAKLYEYYAL